MTLNSFVSETKPTKFVSKRMEEKKQNMGLTNNVVYRTFNPRKPPYLQVYSKINSSKNILNENDFPSL